MSPLDVAPTEVAQTDTAPTDIDSTDDTLIDVDPNVLPPKDYKNSGFRIEKNSVVHPI